MFMPLSFGDKCFPLTWRFGAIKRGGMHMFDAIDQLQCSVIKVKASACFFVLNRANLEQWKKPCMHFKHALQHTWCE